MTDIYGYAAAAPLYRAAGWMQVIPLPEGRKTPPPSGFTGRSRKPVTDEQVRFWSQSDPTANTGIVIPEGVLVLDIDAEQGHQVKADGAKGISELSQELGMLPATWSSTAHGIDSPARHLFYKVPEGARVEGRRHRGRRHPAARPQVFRRMAKHPPLRRNVLLVHTQRLDHQPDPPYQRSGYPAVEMGGLSAQTGAYDAETNF